MQLSSPKLKKFLIFFPKKKILIFQERTWKGRKIQISCVFLIFREVEVCSPKSKKFLNFSSIFNFLH